MSSYVTRKTDGDTAWFTHDRFGMFIHFGLYAMPARGEWVKTQELTAEDKYDKYTKSASVSSIPKVLPRYSEVAFSSKPK